MGKHGPRKPNKTVSELGLSEYLRWLAGTFTGEPDTKAELLRRAEQADKLETIPPGARRSDER